MKNRLSAPALKRGILPSNEAMYNFLIERVRENLHIVLCMSPIGDSFRNRLRQYPSLVNCTTIDWFFEWPKEALLEVANKFIQDVNFVATITGEQLVSFYFPSWDSPFSNRFVIFPQTKRRESVLFSTQDKLREGVSAVFATIHDSVAQCSKLMAAEMKRYNYVTPTNYLELVTGYKA